MTAFAHEINSDQQWIQLMAAGANTMQDGRGQIVLKNMAAVIAASQRPKTDLVIDRDHQFYYSQPGTTVLAAGWIKEMQARADGIWARVEWTDTARQQLAAKEYRYFSPEFTINKVTREVIKITGGSIVNRPALELQAVASIQNNQPEELPMKELLQRMAAALHLATDATEEAVMAAIKSNLDEVTKANTLAASLRKELGLDDKADTTAMAAAITGLRAKQTVDKPDPAQFVTMAAFTEVTQQLSALQKSANARAVEEVVAAAMKEGKVSPAMKAWATDLAASSMDKFKAFIASAPKIVDGQTVVEAAASQQPVNTLTDEQLAFAAAIGIKAETITADIKAEAAKN